MNIRLVITITLLALAVCTDHVAAADSVPLHWNCARSGTPSLRETAATYGYDNYVRVVPARDALYRQIRHACARGADRIVVVDPRIPQRAASDMASR